jgi:hypothetical protein
MVMRRAVMGFLAGFVAVPVFHQLAALALHWLGLLPPPWDLAPTPPFDVPALLSASFWGGLWGVLLAFVLARTGGGTGYWLTALLFGAVVLTLLAWLVVLPAKGIPLAAALAWPRVLIGPVVNGAWGLGAALLLRLERRHAHVPA